MSTLFLIFLLSRFHTRFWSCRRMITRSLLFIQKFCDGSWNLVNIIIFMPKCKSLGRQYRKVHRDSCANISHTTSRIRFFAYFFTTMRYPLHIRIFYPGLLASHTYKQNAQTQRLKPFIHNNTQTKFSWSFRIHTTHALCADSTVTIKGQLFSHGWLPKHQVSSMKILLRLRPERS